jgi:SAM-dependent methyltransferase
MTSRRRAMSNNGSATCPATSSIWYSADNVRAGPRFQQYVQEGARAQNSRPRFGSWRAVAATFAKQFPSESVVSTDLSEDMHMKAKALAVNTPNMEAHMAAMQNLIDFYDDEIHVVSSSYGFVFPPGKEKALQETFRVLKPGGILVSTSWDSVPHLDMTADLSERTFGVRKPPTIDPLSLSEPGLLEGRLCWRPLDFFVPVLIRKSFGRIIVSS